MELLDHNEFYYHKSGSICNKIDMDLNRIDRDLILLPFFQRFVI